MLQNHAAGAGHVMADQRIFPVRHFSAAMSLIAAKGRQRQQKWSSVEGWEVD